MTDPAATELLADWNRELLESDPSFDLEGGSIVLPMDFEPPDGVFLVAFLDEGPMGCCGIRQLGPRSAELKRLYVRREARQSGIGSRLLSTAEKVCREHGYAELLLDTSDQITRAFFESRGFEEITPYNENEYARYWLAKAVT